MASTKQKPPANPIQQYPRIDKGKSGGLLDDNCLAIHVTRMNEASLPTAIITAIRNANKRSSREMLSLSVTAGEVEKQNVYKKAGLDLFRYFRKYQNDPASAAFQLQNKSCREVGEWHFNLKALQKERMNSGWRYQYLAIDCARATHRFLGVNDLGLKEADFSATVLVTTTNKRLGIYVSVKNRENTIGGPDWPKSIQALEKVAIDEMNKVDHYICIFGFAMEGGGRRFKKTKDGALRSNNVELWGADYFWPFFANYAYEEIMKSVLKVLIDNPETEKLSVDVPKEVLDEFEACCRNTGLVDANGCFNDPYKLVEFFCNRQPSKKTKSSVALPK